MNVEQEFEKYFENITVQTNGGEHGMRDYCKWLLKGRKGKEPMALDPETKRRSSEWYGRCEQLFKEAERLALSGEDRNGRAFDDLKQRSLALADEVFSGADRGIVFGRVAQVFDEKVNSVLPSAGGVNGIDGVWEPYPLLDKGEYAVLMEIQKFAGWGAGYREDMRLAKERFVERFPGDQHLIAIAESNGRLFSEVKNWAYKLGVSNGKMGALTDVLSHTRIPKHLCKFICDAFDKGRKAASRARAASELKKALKGSSGESRKAPVNPNLPEKECAPVFKNQNENAAQTTWHSAPQGNSILNLKHANRWTIVADETGSLFGNDAFESSKNSGRYVFVLIPEYADLPKLALGWHAVNKDMSELMSAAEDLSKSGCGILGIPIRGLYQTNRDLWFSSIETLLDITLRLLPVEGATEISLKVEQRGKADAGSNELLNKTIDDVMYHLSLVNPEKAKDISLFASFISKTDCPFNGYADLVAFSWGCGKDVRQVLGKFGWEGPCLVSDSLDVVHAFRRCLDLVHQGVLPVADWNVLVQSRDAQAAGSLIGALLRAFGEEARKDVARWRLYLDYVMAHLDSKSIRMFVLKPQIAWLKEYEPDAAQLPPRLRLLWLTAQLAESNHLGGTKFGAEVHEREFVELCERLKDEDAPLTCFAALHLAVEKTDSYEFDVARSILKPWESESIAVPGLRYHAQVLSSLGQHAAFLGDNKRALEYLRKAMDEFKRLSADWQRDFDQTCAYAVIAAMDAGDSEMNDLMATYLYGGAYSIETMIDKARQLSAVGEDEPDSKYAHAILLRYIVTLPPDNPVRSAYVANSAKWQWSDDGHPWELIAFYRALLLPQGDPARCEWLRKGYNLCANGGPTLRAIAAVLLGALLHDGAASRDEYVAKAEEVINLLPSLGEARVSALLAHADKPIPPLGLAKVVLPFNFR